MRFKTQSWKPGVQELCLAGLWLIFAYAVFQSGGIIAAEWNKCIVAVGLLALVYFSRTGRNDLAPTLEWWFLVPLLLLLAFIGLQLVPLPASLLRTLSPARAALLESLGQVSPENVSAPITVFPPATLAHLLRVATYIVVFALARELSWRMGNQRWLVVAPVIITAAAEAAFGILQYDPLTPEPGVHGTYDSRNHFVGLLELALPFAVVYPITALVGHKHRPRRAVLLASASIVAAALILVAIILSLSRMGFMASLAALFVVGSIIAGRRESARRRFLVIALVAAAALAAFVYLAPERLMQRFAAAFGTMDVPQDARIQLWADAWRLAEDYPLVGCGLGAFEPAFLKYRTYATQVAVDFIRNDYLQLLIELGRIGLAIAAFAMLALLAAAFRGIFGSVDSSARYIGTACLGAIVAILMHSFVDYNLYIPANAMLFAWIAGVVASLSIPAQELAVQRVRRSKAV